MADIVVTIQGNSELAQKLRKFGVAVLDLSKGMEDVGDYLTGFFSGEVFASRGGVIDESWPSLSRSYAAYKARQWPGRPPLVRSGEMLGSFKSTNTRLSVRIFNTAGHFDYHQEGTRHMPARVMMKVDEARARRIVNYLKDDLDRQMEASGV